MVAQQVTERKIRGTLWLVIEKMLGEVRIVFIIASNESRDRKEDSLDITGYSSLVGDSEWRLKECSKRYTYATTLVHKSTMFLNEKRLAAANN